MYPWYTKELKEILVQVTTAKDIMTAAAYILNLDKTYINDNRQEIKEAYEELCMARDIIIGSMMKLEKAIKEE